MTNPYEPSSSNEDDSDDRLLQSHFPIFSVGPLTGATVGISHVSAAVLAWWIHDCPDFLIRTGTATVFAIAVAIGGLMFGLLYGLVVKIVCYNLQVSVCRDVHIWIANGTSFAIAFIASDYALRGRETAYLPFLSLALTVAISFVVAIATSKRNLRSKRLFQCTSEFAITKKWTEVANKVIVPW
jgi:hypothetical protein